MITIKYDATDIGIELNFGLDGTVYLQGEEANPFLNELWGKGELNPNDAMYWEAESYSIVAQREQP